ncbi:PepSY domain-containing protein [Pelagibius sp. Alg239-R121]|uniref:PepSY domain-containing protein n=1 Tax=Pelagibius sp. Alg239-R121 TaxID=2993448 RepID=UPI0024A6CAF0|nr:PepSY domain-containing protein [Pelagibius sp. Alg239-R121]
MIKVAVKLLTGTPRALVLALALTVMALSAGLAAAKDHDKARDAVSSGQAQPLDAILPKVRARYPGRLLDAKLTRSGGKYRYVIKILDKKGKVRRVTVDARSGRILK